ncbi:glycoside hydrolase family 15 protein [Actinomadura citrea]|uniref:GH15 family glucan-1,4-alpha-glucosidase n=1 Tax=Actinomadura citrea TaxID=46158 RepID=A0A7Y9GAD5_9ACTN|nr:glycoside hydrolase family 15 protein [Actinomadura citrea]NYE11435.1 GH15 family glucan-1,4-alpha-glucosidase [Actinomadura citrea]
MFKSPQHTRSGFPRIEALGYVSDGETCLLAEGGDIHWMCLPEMDGPSVFSGLLGGAGHFFVGLNDGARPVAQRNVSRSLGIETTWETPAGGRLVVTDVLVMVPGSGARRTLVRLARCTKGQVQVTADLKMVFDYGREPAKWDRSVARSRDGLEVRLTTDLRRRGVFSGDGLKERRTLQQGDGAFISLAWGDDAPPKNYQEAERLVKETATYWRSWLDSGDLPDHEFGDLIARSALVLRGLCNPSGAIAAAATTSLPETPGGVRNWDYRYFWGRDGAMTAMALFEYGFREPADRLVRFLERLPEEDVQIMYGLRGQTRLVEETLTHLSGYEGAAPVHIGNGAYNQVQNDIWGQLLELIYKTQRGRLTARTWRLVVRLVQGALKAWGQPDRGIWEVRGVPRRFTSSELYLWVALDRGSKLAEDRGDTDRAREWAKAAQEIRKEILEGVGEDGVFTASAGSPELDASCLLIPLLGFLPGDDWRVRKTVHAIAEGLEYKGMLRRYNAEEYGDGLPGEEMAFVITAFWLVESFIAIGEVGRAEVLFRKVTGYVGPLGLLAEEIDPGSDAESDAESTGWRQYGNQVQAFSHLGLLKAARALIKAGRS